MDKYGEGRDIIFILMLYLQLVFTCVLWGASLKGQYFVKTFWFKCNDEIFILLITDFFLQPR